MPAVSSSVRVPYTSYLRVYEPLAAFPEPERAHWTRYARLSATPTAQDEQRRSLADLLPTPPVPVRVHESADAFVAEVDGVVCVCPWRTRLRGWLALEELGETLPGALLEAALPQVVRDQAAGDYERWRAGNPDARPWIRSSVWQVPVGWFTLFSDDERQYTPGTGALGGVPAGAGADTDADAGAPADGPGGADGEGEGAGEPDGSLGGTGTGDRSGCAPTLRYRTPMVQARRRLARGLKAVRDTIDDGPLTERLIDVGRWLEEFHPRSLVELDYGGLVHVLSDEHLAQDHSAADVAEGIAALRDGDGEGAGAAYARLTERWRAVRDLQFAN
ncbi:hypothetical protein [Streptomyces fuscigenes]|uniref:hypothetical protein n=1 Tax=Streptomyces fuscigenes TaxID=1528880 RepID=UPI001F2FBB02|nr:hypothetical protein [Streptomyces fuscigenes]MCF3965009.1 hypothetical protein [Streptomyces fuscigenes]